MKQSKHWKGYTFDQLKKQRTQNYLARKLVKEKLFNSIANNISIIETIQKGYKLYKEHGSFFASI